jgi:5'-3' exonuclease
VLAHDGVLYDHYVAVVMSIKVIEVPGDKADNIPRIEGIGDVNVVKLTTKFGSLENL